MDEITAEYAAQDLAPSAELTTRVRFTLAAKTDMGRVRENNEDKFEFYCPESESLLATRGNVFVVCDGMGGHEAGQIASELATKTFLEVYLNHPAESPEVALESAVRAANRFVFDVAFAIPSRRGMGTTLSGLALIQNRAYLAQVGDSRIYRLRQGELRQLTVDHTWVEEVVAKGLFTRAEAEAHQYRNVLTRAVGTEGLVQVDLFTTELEVDDTFLLCSDGLTTHVDDAQIQGLLNDHTPAEAAWKLVGAALMGGGSDNVTVVVVRIDGLDPVG